jgi:hypothetical protein
MQRSRPATIRPRAAVARPDDRYLMLDPASPYQKLGKLGRKAVC